MVYTTIDRAGYYIINKVVRMLNWAWPTMCHSAVFIGLKRLYGRCKACNMVKTREISTALREKVISFYKQGLSVRKVASRLDLVHTTVQYIIQKYRKTATVVNTPGRGRKAKTTVRTDRYIRQLAMKNRKLSAKKIASEVQEATGTSLCPQSVRNRLNDTGLSGRIARKKPYISDRNKRKRLAFAKEHVNKPAEFWNSILWSDESKFNMFGCDGRARVWRSKHEAFSQSCLKPTVKHGGGSVMVWGCMAASGVGDLHFIDGIMNAEV